MVPSKFVFETLFIIPIHIPRIMFAIGNVCFVRDLGAY